MNSNNELPSNSALKAWPKSLFFLLSLLFRFANTNMLFLCIKHRNYTVLCVSVSNTCCDLRFVLFCFLCVLASVDYNSNQSSLELTFAVCLMCLILL